MIVESTTAARMTYMAENLSGTASRGSYALVARSLPAVAPFITYRLPRPSDVSEEARDRRRRFEELTSEWKSAATSESLARRMAEHPAYRKIMTWGPSAIPLILEDMEKSGGHWFIALRALAGESPVPDTLRGNMAEMRKAWIDWGRKNGYLA